MNQFQIFGVICLFMSALFISILVVADLRGDIKYETKEVSCYDVHQNEIIGLTCNSEKQVLSPLQLLIVIFGVISFATGVIILIAEGEK